MSECKENYIKVNGAELCWFEWGELRADQPTYLLVHATGFHARCWDQIARHLIELHAGAGQAGVNHAGEGFHLIALELRGHGRSEKKGPYSWDYFGSDVTEFIEALNLKHIVGAGHSMGGYSLTQAAAKQQQRFERLVLIDPVIMEPSIYEQGASSHIKWTEDTGEHPVARRRNHFEDADEMFNDFKHKGSYGLWDERILKDYCEYGLLPNPEGRGYVLACPPQVEAAIYMGNDKRNIYPLIDTIDIAVKVLRAAQHDGERRKMDFSKSPTWEGLAGCFRQGRDVYLPELTHFIPMQEPELTARHLMNQNL